MYIHAHQMLEYSSNDGMFMQVVIYVHDKLAGCNDDESLVHEDHNTKVILSLLVCFMHQNDMALIDNEQNMSYEGTCFVLGVLKDTQECLWIFTDGHWCF